MVIVGNSGAINEKFRPCANDRSAVGAGYTEGNAQRVRQNNGHTVASRFKEGKE
tara:strand:+ start:98 stop:259 length:162 start_codon:yes stop_codon:yes gene_type:complete